MTEVQILAGLTDVFRDIFDDPALVISDETTADDIDEWDSLNHINLVIAAQSRFGVKFKTGEIETLKNVGDLVQLIRQRLAHRG
jgi:acyl carrier protein